MPVTADEARPQGQKIPFGTGCFEYLHRIDIDKVEGKAQFVYQCDIDVTLGVLTWLSDDAITLIPVRVQTRICSIPDTPNGMASSWPCSPRVC